MEYVKAENISKIYHRNQKHEVRTIDGINLSLQEGEFVCVMGPSGSGKSTLLHVLTTLDRPTLGKVFMEGVNIKNMPENKMLEFRGKHLGFVFQDYQLLDELTIADNILLPLAVNDMEKTEADARCLEIAEKVNITHVLDKYPHECSGGECQRAAIARALIHKPSLLAMDEPTGNLDSVHSHEILTMISSINKEFHNTILMVTHDAMIASYADRVIYLRDGKIEQTLAREQLTQDEFFYQITRQHAKEAMELIREKKQ